MDQRRKIIRNIIWLIVTIIFVLLILHFVNVIAAKDIMINPLPLIIGD